MDVLAACLVSQSLPCAMRKLGLVLSEQGFRTAIQIARQSLTEPALLAHFRQHHQIDPVTHFGLADIGIHDIGINAKLPGQIVAIRILI